MNETWTALGISIRTLARWATIPRGPQRHTFEGAVRYLAAEVLAYRAERDAAGLPVGPLPDGVAE